MAAGLGFKTFTTGEVLTAADTNGYLMQGVLVFASAAARDAAITSPQEGQFAYLKDTNVTTYYTGSAWTNLDTTGMTNPMTTTGDMVYSSSGSTPARLGIGTTGQVLTVAGGIPSWATASSTSGPAFFAYRSGNQSITSGTGTKVAFNAESFDTDNCFDTTTNYRFTPTKSGYYQMNSSIECAGATVTRTVLMFFKNGSEYQRFVDYSSTASNLFSGSTLMYFNGSSDYAEVYVQVNGTSLTVNGAVNATTFTGVWIRS